MGARLDLRPDEIPTTRTTSTSSVPGPRPPVVPRGGIRMKTYGFGVIGMGLAGRAQAAAIVKNSRARLKAICTPSARRLDATAAEFQPDVATTDFQKLLAAGLDVLVVCTPDHLHTDYVSAGLESGLHILCEKPLVTKLNDARLLVDRARRSGKVFMTGQCARFFTRSGLARAMVDQGELGDLFFVEADYLHNCEEFFSSGWRVDPAAPQNMALGGGCHPIDLLRWLAGDVAEVYAVANRKCFAPGNPIAHDCILMSLKFCSGAIGKVLVSVGCRRPYSLGLSLYGNKGTLVDEKLFLAKVPNLQDFMPVPVGSHGHDLGYIFEEQLAHLVECMDAGRQPMADAVEGAKTVATCLAAIESIETGKVVRVCNEF